MNFFEHQDRARKTTTRLVLLFIVAVILILAAVNAAAFGILRLLSPQMSYVRDAAPVIREDTSYPGELSQIEPLWKHPRWYIVVTGCTLLIVASGSLYKSAMLSRGGPALAQSLGGQQLRLQSPDPQDRMLQNVVEEMSIASGVPVPQVYVMENEQGINAFAAGLTTRDAVIGVTRGCLQKLNRDELQGVIAHEFSHILNGDMRLNLRLIGILHGILVIALIGFAIMRSLGRVRVSRGGGKNGGGAAAMVLIIVLSGAAMLIIGYVGVFFGRLIQAAVSRQREFLADASAVQFTRNPSGLVGALQKIGVEGSKVMNHNAIEAAHMFFGSALGSGFFRLMATHPPLEERIRAIDPRSQHQLRSTPISAPAPTAGVAGFAGQAARVQPDAITDRAGALLPEEVPYADRFADSIPRDIVAAAHDPFAARAVIFALLLSDDPSVQARQLQIIRQTVEPDCYRATLRMVESVPLLGPSARLPLLDLTLGALRALSQAQIAELKAIVRALIEADARISLFEFALARVLDQNLRQPDLPVPTAVKYWAVGAVKDEAATVLSALAVASRGDTAAAFDAGARLLDPESPPRIVAKPDLATIDAALRKLAQSSPTVKQRVIDAAAHVVAADGQIKSGEAELLRAVAATMDVPIPPMQ